MRNAIRHLDRVYSGASEANIFEPPRGPAIVTHLPLNPVPLTFLAASAVEAGGHRLKAALMLGGCCCRRRGVLAVPGFFGGRGFLARLRGAGSLTRGRRGAAERACPRSR